VGNQSGSHLQRLHALNGVLHFGIKILYAHAEPVEAEPPESFEVLGRGDTRVDLDADLRVGSKGKSLRRETEKILHLRRSQIRGRSAAPMKLYDLTGTGNARADMLDFSF
jgi:hypothetical protein